MFFRPLAQLDQKQESECAGSERAAGASSTIFLSHISHSRQTHLSEAGIPRRAEAIIEKCAPVTAEDMAEFVCYSHKALAGLQSVIECNRESRNTVLPRRNLGARIFVHEFPDRFRN
jgi:hypothetical protein